MPALYSAGKRSSQALPMNGFASFTGGTMISDDGWESQIHPAFLGELILDACITLALALDPTHVIAFAVDAIKTLAGGSDATATIDTEKC